MYLYIWYFFIYAFLGWCAEVIFAASNSGKFVNRGFLNGPVCPIYGFGVAIVIACLTPLKGSIILLFLGSIILTSALEWLAGWLLRKIFHQKWWDYSDLPLNINGYICLKFSLMWGLACLLIMNGIQPTIYNIIVLIPDEVGKVLLGIFLFVITADIWATVQSILKLNTQLKYLNEIAAKMRNVSDKIRERISKESISILVKSEGLKNIFDERKSAINKSAGEHKVILVQKLGKVNAQRVELREKREKLLNNAFFGRNRLLHAFPGMKSNHYKEALEDLKQKILKK